MNEYIKNAVSKLIYATNPEDVAITLIQLNEMDQDVCIEIALEQYHRSCISKELVSLVKEPNSDLLSYFLSDKIYFLDKEVLEEMWKRKGRNYNFEIDYSVMIDTNYASYISEFILRPENLDSKVRKNLDVLIRNNFRFDYTIYIIENFYNVFHAEGVSDETLQKKRIHFYNNLFNLELFKNINIQQYVEQGIITFDIDKSEAYVLTDVLYNDLLNSQDSKDKMKVYSEIHKMMMLYIIGILKVRFSSDKAPRNKMIEMFKFMYEVAGVYFEREIKFTYDYFENPKKYKMFDKIYKDIEKPKLKKIIKNIAWDFSIPRIVERSIIHSSMTRYLVPLVLTHDTNLKTVFNAYQVKGVLFDTNKSFIIPYSDKNILEYLKEKKCKIDYYALFSGKANEKRIKVFEKNKKDGFKVIDDELDKLVEVLRS